MAETDDWLILLSAGREARFGYKGDCIWFFSWDDVNVWCKPCMIQKERLDAFFFLPRLIPLVNY